MARTPAETWIELIQRAIEEGRSRGDDSYVVALQVYREVVAKAVQERQDEFDFAVLVHTDRPAN